jgi:hypothetical protein
MCLEFEKLTMKMKNNQGKMVGEKSHARKLTLLLLLIVKLTLLLLLIVKLSVLFSGSATIMPAKCVIISHLQFG